MRWLVKQTLLSGFDLLLASFLLLDMPVALHLI
jgi:hypothetical protein